MNIYKCSQTDNGNYDTYDSFVCYAKDETEARNMLPDDKYADWYTPPKPKQAYGRGEWAISPDSVKVEFIGLAPQQTEAKVILASFNAG